MSQTPHPWRHAAARLAVLVVAAACLSGLAPGAVGETGSDAPRRWSGYAIPATGEAAGGWIGGYRVGSTELYLTTPTRRPNRSGFASPRQVGDLPGRRATGPETARAAWILSKYGAYRDATQAAAVDATVYHLLVGRAWQIDDRHGARRIRQSGDPAAVRRFARIMLRQSRQSAGAYTARLAASGADLGGTVAVTLSVLDGHGRPAAGLPVTLAMSGAEPRSAVTGDDGRAVVRFSAEARGWQDVVAEVAHVPEHRLLVHRPEQDNQAAAAEGGATRTLVASTRVAVRGPQTLSLAADPTLLVAGAAARVAMTVTGDGADRTATAALHGPFASAAAAHCAGPSVGQVSTQVASDGTYLLPPVTPSGGGFFAWRAGIDGTDTSLPVAACGAPTKVRARTSTGILTDASVALVGELGATGSVTGLPFADQVSLTATLAGPYATEAAAAADGCATSAGEASRVRVGNGSVHFTIAVTQPGFYAWQVQTSPGDLWLGSRSTCAAGGTVVTAH